jgi:hypothetical protein
MQQLIGCSDEAVVLYGNNYIFDNVYNINFYAEKGFIMLYYKEAERTSRP